MHNNDLGFIIPAGKAFFSAGMMNYSNNNPAYTSDFSSKSGVVIIGFGNTGKDTLDVIFNHIFQSRTDNSPIIRALLITDGKGETKVNIDSRIEQFSISDVERAEIAQMDGERKINAFGNIKKYIENQLRELKHSFGVSADIRFFLVACLSESEIDLIKPTLEILAENRNSFYDRSNFILFQSPSVPKLDQQRQYSIIRELGHYMQTGAHKPENLTQDKMLERVYFFEGSKRQEDYQKSITALTETVSAFLNGGSSLRQYEAVGQSTDGNHRIRTVGIRSLTIPITELTNYFTSRLMREMWVQNKTLYPSNGPSADDINLNFRAFHNDKNYSNYLQQWLGVGFARWLLDQGSSIPAINESEIALLFIQRMLDFLSDTRQPERFAISGSGLWFVEGRTAGFPILQDACRKFRSGLENYFEAIPNYSSYLNTLIKTTKTVLDKTNIDPISRWNIRNLDEHIEHLYERLLGNIQKELIFEQIKQRSGLSAKYNDIFLLSPLLVPLETRKQFVLSDHIQRNYTDYFRCLYGIISSHVQSAMLDSGEKINNLDEEAFHYLSEMEQPLADLESPLQSDNKQGFLFASKNEDIDSIHRRVFKFTSNFMNIPLSNDKSVTALAIFTGLRMDSFKHIRQAADVYKPDEKTHFDQHLKNAAYFEKQLRKSANSKSRDLFCDQLIITLSDREAPISFFKAYMAGILEWNESKMVWQISPINQKGFNYPELLLTDSRPDSLIGEILKKNIQSLWKAYCRFVISETDLRAVHKPLHPNNRVKYFESLGAIAKINISVEQGNRKKWLEKEGEANRENVELYDFYRLFQAVLRSL